MKKPRDAFELAYEKFAAFVKQYNLFPTDRTQIVVAYSGGKDASLLCDLLSEYKGRERPGLALELLTALFPRFIYDSPDKERKKLVETAVGHWIERGFRLTKIDAGPDFPDSILDQPNPCQHCALVVKPTLLGREISKPRYRNAVYCVGLTLDDCIGWFLELLLTAADRGHWQEIKKTNPALFALTISLAIRVTARLQIENNSLLYSRPLMNFSDGEIREIVANRNLPLIPEDCQEVMGREGFSDSPRRELGLVLATLRKKYPAPSAIGQETIYSDYTRAIRFFEKTGLLPDQSEREAFISQNLTCFRL